MDAIFASAGFDKNLIQENLLSLPDYQLSPKLKGYLLGYKDQCSDPSPGISGVERSVSREQVANFAGESFPGYVVSTRNL